MKQRRASTRSMLRFGGRVGAALVASLIVLLVGIQFGRAIDENVAMGRELGAVRSDIGALQAHRLQQQRELKRLADPLGAVPEIHDRLRLVLPNEAIIFVSPVPSSAP
jgi:hypothetical protein